MLTADLADPSVRKGHLTTAPLAKKARDRALELAAGILDAYWASRNESRAVLKTRVDAIDAGAREQKRKGGLVKILDDACTFSAPSDTDYVASREVVHRAVHAARAEAHTEEPNIRAVGVAALVTQLELTEDDAHAVMANLYGDLKSAQLLQSVPAWDPALLVALYEDARPMAVLLRARTVVATLTRTTPDALRMLVRKLRFRELLFTVEAPQEGTFTFVIDGPFSLFTGRTKYGLRLALALRALREAGHLDLEAEVSWGAAKKKRTFAYQSRPAALSAVPLDDEHTDVPKSIERTQAALTAQGFTSAPAQYLKVNAGSGIFCPALRIDAMPPVYVDVIDKGSRGAGLSRIEQARQSDERCVMVVHKALKLAPSLAQDAPHVEIVVFTRVPDKKALAAAVKALVAPAE